MKRVYITMLTGLLALSLWVPAAAAPQLDYVTDQADLLTDQEETDLAAAAADMEAAYGCAPYIITLEDYTDTGYYDVEEAAEALYLDHDLGVGEDRSGILLMLSMAERDYALYAFGYGNIAFTDYGKDYLEDAFLTSFGSDLWYEGFQAFLTTGGDMLWQARYDQPVDVGMEETEEAAPMQTALAVGICIAVSFLIAFLVRWGLKSQLESVREGTRAEAFVSGGGLDLSEREDWYLYTTESRVYDPPQKSNSGGGGTTISSSGGSSSSGKF